MTAGEKTLVRSGESIRAFLLLSDEQCGLREQQQVTGLQGRLAICIGEEHECVAP